MVNGQGGLISRNRKALLNKGLAALLCLLLLTALTPIAATASSSAPVPYVDENGDPRTSPDYTLDYTGQALLGDMASTTWVAVTATRNVDDRIMILGNVNLILLDGVTLNANSGIHVAAGSSLTLYAQEAGTGALVAVGSPGNAGIGGNNIADSVSGAVIINGGVIHATGGMGAAGIGGGYDADNGGVTINRGSVTAIGTGGGAGIGGGDNGTSGTITITGGTVTARGGDGTLNNGGAAGIGSGGTSGSTPRGIGSITITGGTVTAIGGAAGSDRGGAGASIGQGGFDGLTGQGRGAGIGSLIQPSPVTISETLDAIFTIEAPIIGTFPPTRTLQWQVSADNGATWSNITNATAETLTLSAATAAMNGNLYRCEIIAQNINGDGTGTLRVESRPALLTVNAAPESAPAITTTVLPAGVLNTPYRAELRATGTPALFTWSVVTGALPDGLTLDAATGVIEGIPTRADTFAFAVRAENSAGLSEVRELNLTINPRSPLPVTGDGFPTAPLAIGMGLAFAGLAWMILRARRRQARG